MENKDYKKDLEFLAKDEEEAIEGYDKVIEKMDDDDPLKEQLTKIRDEEKAHLDFLRKAQEDKDAEYVDPSEPDNNDGDVEEREQASILFKINLNGGK